VSVTIRPVSPPRRSLADGVVVEASILVRLLKLKLLTLDATILVLPPDGMEPAGRRLPAGDARLSDALRDIDRASSLLARARNGHTAPDRWL